MKKSKTSKSEPSASNSVEEPIAQKTPSAGNMSTELIAAGATSSPASDGARSGFPVVGIGASAGGLEALEELLRNLPIETGMAFVVLTHQHPGHVCLLPDLLGKLTKMPVVVASDGMKLEPNHVYVCPPGGHLSILNRTLRRMETEKEESPRLPIDYFFRSLADDQKERAICIVLSE